MTFLPIAARELRVASRRRFSFQVRLVTALGAALLAFAVMAFTDAQSRTAGSFLFSRLTVGAFLFALSAGVFLAADTISEEKRDGTLGLLLLTDLGGFDIVAGKLLITGLNALLALMAVLPVVAVAWILGGVTGGEFWRTALALLNTLFVSLAVSLAVSACQRTQTAALAWSAGLLAVLTLGGALLFRLAVSVGVSPGLRGGLGFGLSPWVGFRAATDAAYRMAPDRFWWSLIVAHGAAWLSLFIAARQTQSHWRQVEETPARRRPLQILIGAGGEIFGLCRPARALRTEILARNPVLALLETRPSFRPAVWAVAGLAALLVVTNVLANGPPLMPFTYLPFVGNLTPQHLASLGLTGLLLLLKTLFAWQACEFFATSRRSGALELLLSTPLRDDDLLSGQWLSLRRTFMAPLLFLLVVLALGPLLHAFLASSGGGAAGSSPVDALAAWGAWLYTLVTLPLELLAIAWMGVWLALTGARPGYAFARTVLLVVAIPAVFFCLPGFLAAGLWFAYARNKMALPLRVILQGARDPHPLTTWAGLPRGGGKNQSLLK
jgi:ABC-type transport system involved in multi-copper enzyme maturation permease subunit